ncbi:Hypothetical_protein [Hexamita inflata]|uniref:Hypothetical_protein n=1 Tax=Hexamita inflata TaxID=28002 RepID=A0AA86P3F9_9EUKA|nr:Hypothetical protein HINF_LOCUS17364 [Hexamita inflata]
MEVEDHKQNNCCFRVASIYYLMLGPTNPLDSILQETKMHSLFEYWNESDCNYLNYNSNQAKYQYFILAPVEIEKKSSIVFRDQEIPKIVQIDQLKMNTGPLQVQCLRYQLQITYCVRIPIIGSSYSFLHQAQLPYIFEINLSQISFVDQTQKLHRDILNK